MAKYWETKDFKVLELKWAKQLEADGFQDAERTLIKDRKTGEVKLSTGKRQLKQRSSNAYRQACRSVREAKESYYRLLSQRVNEETFEDPVHKLIMVKRSEAVEIKDIVQELKLQGYRIHRQTVRYVIRRYEARWKIKRWTPKQYNLKRPIK